MPFTPEQETEILAMLATFQATQYKTISELEAATEVVGGMQTPVEDGIGTFAASIDDFKNYINVKAGETTSIVTAAGTTNLTNSSTPIQIFTGSDIQTVVLPDATTLKKDRTFQVINTSTGTVTLNFYGGSLAASILSGSRITIKVLDISSAAGTWIIIPDNVSSDLAAIYGASSQTNELVPIKVSGVFVNKITKRGSLSSTSGATVTFSTPFPTACQTVKLTCEDSAANFRHAFLANSSPTTSQFEFVVNSSAGTSATADFVYWEATGY